MGKEFILGRVVISTKATGKMIKEMEKASSLSAVVIATMATGKMI